MGKTRQGSAQGARAALVDQSAASRAVPSDARAPKSRVPSA